MPSVDQLRELVVKMREGLVLLDEKRQAISLINAMENAKVKA